MIYLAKIHPINIFVLSRHFFLFHKIRLGQKLDSLGSEAHLIYHKNSVESSNALIIPLTTTGHKLPKEGL